MAVTLPDHLGRPMHVLGDRARVRESVPNCRIGVSGDTSARIPAPRRSALFFLNLISDLAEIDFLRFIGYHTRHLAVHQARRVEEPPRHPAGRVILFSGRELLGVLTGSP